MSGYVTFQVQFKIQSPDGTSTVYQGTGRISGWHEVALNDTAAALPAEALVIDAANSVLGFPTATVAATEEIMVARIVNGTSKGVLGVTLEGIRPRTGASTIGMATGRVAASGSIVPVRTNGTFAVNTLAITSSTAGQLTSNAAVVAGATAGLIIQGNQSVGAVNMGGLMVGPQ